MIDLATVERDVLAQSREDYVGLWVFVWHARRAGADDATLRPTVVALIGRLLSDGCLVAGQFNRSREFEVWREPVPEIVARIDREWRALGHDPTLGEIVWLVAP